MLGSVNTESTVKETTMKQARESEASDGAGVTVATGRRSRRPDAELRILKAATTLFALEGFARVTVPAVAARAKVGLNTLYQRYPSKEALGNAVYRRAMRSWAKETLENWPADATPAEEFAIYWERLSAFAARERDMALLNERQHLGHDLDAESEALHADLNSRSAMILQRWSGGGLPLEVMQALVHGTFHRFLELDVAESRRAELLREARPAIWAALTARRGAKAETTHRD